MSLLNHKNTSINFIFESIRTKFQEREQEAKGRRTPTEETFSTFMGILILMLKKGDEIQGCSWREQFLHIWKLSLLVLTWKVLVIHQIKHNDGNCWPCDNQSNDQEPGGRGAECCYEIFRHCPLQHFPRGLGHRSIFAVYHSCSCRCIS